MHFRSEEVPRRKLLALYIVATERDVEVFSHYLIYSAKEDGWTVMNFCSAAVEAGPVCTLTELSDDGRLHASAMLARTCMVLAMSASAPMMHLEKAIE